MNESAVKALFAELKQAEADDEDPDAIGVDGLMALGEKLGIDVSSDTAVLVFSFFARAEQQCRYTLEEWVHGCKALGYVVFPAIIVCTDEAALLTLLLQYRQLGEV